MMAASKSDLLWRIAGLRGALLCSDDAAVMEARLRSFCSSLLLWVDLPEAASGYYGHRVLDVAFRLAEDVEDDPTLGEAQRDSIQLSLWQALDALGLSALDQRRLKFITAQELRLQRRLASRPISSATRLLNSWAILLTKQHGKIRELPGPMREEISAVVTQLRNAGLPRRAKALADVFQLTVDQLTRWAIEHRPEGEEIAKTRTLLDRVKDPPDPVSYRVLVLGRGLQAILESPMNALPISVNSGGIIISQAALSRTQPTRRR